MIFGDIKLNCINPRGFFSFHESGHHLLPRIDTLRSHLLLVKIGHCAIKIRSYSMYFLLYLYVFILVCMTRI